MNVVAKKHFGQNFLKNKSVINKIVCAVDKKYNEIYEIGPGSGAITYELLKQHKVKAIEIDKDCINSLKKHENLQIINQDVLTYEFNNPDCVVGNLPYNIGTKIITNLVYSNLKFGVFMLQKEVAERITGVSFGRLSVFVQARYDVSKVVNVASTDFVPRPKVESQVIKMIKHDNYSNLDLQKLDKILKAMFANKRKKISSLRKTFPEIVEKLISLSIDLNLRPEDLQKEDYYKLAIL